MTEAYSAHTDTHAVYKRNTVLREVNTDYNGLLLPLPPPLLLLHLQLQLLLLLVLQVDIVILYQCVTYQDLLVSFNTILFIHRLR